MFLKFSKFRFLIGTTVLLCLIKVACVNAPPNYEKSVRRKFVVTQDEEIQKEKLIIREKCDVSFLYKYKGSNTWGVKNLIVVNPGVTEQIQKEYVKDSDKYLRAELARSRYTQSHIAKLLWNDNEKIVRMFLASNPNLSEKDLIKLFESFDHETQKQSLWCFAINPSIPKKIEDIIINSNDHSAKYWLRNFPR